MCSHTNYQCQSTSSTYANIYTGHWTPKFFSTETTRKFPYISCLDFCWCFVDVAKRLLLVSSSKKASNTGQHNAAELIILLLWQNINAHAKTTQTGGFFCVNTGSVKNPLTGLANSERQPIDTNDTFSLWLGRVSLNTFKNRLHKKWKHLIGFSVRDKILILI